jgi:hypothetical protein
MLSTMVCPTDCGSGIQQTSGLSFFSTKFHRRLENPRSFRRPGKDGHQPNGSKRTADNVGGKEL